ncbi:MAG: porin [Bacteroidetes bacterium]|nr:porin [Bacteroidota bacterium]
MKKMLWLAAVLMSVEYAAAQQSDSAKDNHKIIITGSVDGYYRYNFNNPKTAPYNSATSFTQSQNSFELGMASLRADHSFGKVSATIDVGFGKRAEEFAYNDANTMLAIKQAYVTYAPSSAIKFTMGTWATHVGYEMLDAYLNRNYSMSYLFTNGPFSHTGIRADVTLKGKSAFMIGISNPTDYRSAATKPKSVIAQFSTATKDDALKWYINFVGGKQSAFKTTMQEDVVASYTITQQFSLGFNATTQHVQLKDSTGKATNYNWSGAALYINYDLVKWLGLTVRGEYIADHDQYLGLKNVFTPTLSANFKIDNLIIISEFRLDHTGDKIFYRKDAATTNTTGSFILAAVYHF